MKLPKGEATSLVTSRFGNDGRVMERFVNRITDYNNRSELIGPAALNRAASKLDVEVAEDPTLRWYSGEYCRYDGRLWALTASYLGPRDRNFTIGHELGHAAIARLWPRFDNWSNSRPDDATEYICEAFAAELLMPWSYLDKHPRALPRLALVSALNSLDCIGAPLSAALRRVADHTGGMAGLTLINDGREVYERSRYDGFRFTTWYEYDHGPVPNWQYGGLRRKESNRGRLPRHEIGPLRDMGNTAAIETIRLSSGRILEAASFNNAKAYIIYPERD